jgi:peptide/nickel transport system substrate-binding protein
MSHPAPLTTLRLASTLRPSSLDRDQPLGLFQFANMDGHLQLYDALLEYRGGSVGNAGARASTRLEPSLAERWEPLDDGARYHFFLRRGVYSAFDHELTAEDVCWTWRRSLALGSVGAWVGANAGLEAAEQVQALDRYTVEFRLPQPTTILPHLLGVIVPTVFDSQEVQRHARVDDPWALAWLRRNGAGFGAYVVDDSSSKGGFRLQSNPRYWRGQVAYTRVEFVPMADPDLRWQSLQRHEVDVALDLPARAYGELRLRSLLAPTTLHTNLRMNCAYPPFDRVEVRRAIAMAIPYERIISEAYGGRAKRMRSCIADTVLGYTAEHARWAGRGTHAAATVRSA